MQLNGKTIIITGASSGIGAAAARVFAREGARLVLGARRRPLLDGVATELREEGGAVEVLEGDVGDESFAEALVRLAEEAFGGLDGAFNNAGTIGELRPIPEMPLSVWHDVVHTNLTAAFLAARHQIPALKRRGGGALVFTSSFVGTTRAGMPGMAAYASAKAGLGGLVRSIAAEHGQEGIRASALLPGGTRTAMAGDDPEGHRQIAALHPLGRMAEPGEIASAAAFLLSDAASFVSGGEMLADGGLSARL